jgi:uncharacterized protein (UPF0332 family)
MGLLEKSDENVRIAKKCLNMDAYNAGVSRAYYAVFQKVEYVLRNSAAFNYEDFIKTNKIDRDHIPHGKMQQAMAMFFLAEKKKVNFSKIVIYDNLYHNRRKADYSNYMFFKTDFVQCLNDMEVILDLIV